MLSASRTSELCLISICLAASLQLALCGITLPKIANPLDTPATQPEKRIFASSLGAAFGNQASVAQRGLGGECVASTFSVGTGVTSVQGPSQAEVGGGVSGDASCGESTDPFQIGGAFFGGFVVTGSNGVGTPSTGINCNSKTLGAGTSSSFSRGDIKSTAAGGFNGGSGCLDPAGPKPPTPVASTATTTPSPTATPSPTTTPSPTG